MDRPGSGGGGLTYALMRASVFLCVAAVCLLTVEVVFIALAKGSMFPSDRWPETMDQMHDWSAYGSSQLTGEWCGREWTRYNYTEHDMVLPIDRPNCITRIVIENAVRFWNFRRLIFIINDGGDCPALLSLADESFRNRVKCVDRNKIIPGVTIDSLEALPPNIRGWIFQQLVKFGAAMHIPNLSPLHLVWDSDLIPLRPIPLFGYIPSLDQPRATFFAGHMEAHNKEAKRAYHEIYGKLTGRRLIDPPGGSWIYGWQVWYRPYVAELLEHITTTAEKSRSEWPKVIIDAIAAEMRTNKSKPRNAFSEFDSYGSWVWTQHPQHVDFWHQSASLWVRYPEALRMGECCPTYGTLCSMAKNYTYVCWENHKFKGCPAHVIYPLSGR